MARPDSTYARRAVRAAVRETIWAALCRHDQGDKPNILLFATRRGGSTFAMEVIAANRGVRPLNQPLETQSRNLTLAQALEIPRFRQGQMTSFAPEDEAAVGRLMERIFSGDIVINAPTRFWDRRFERRSNRLVLKITDAKPVIDWFDQHVDAQIVYLTRHPIPQALSCIRNGWTLTVDAHLSDQRFVQRFVDDAGLVHAHDVMASGNLLDKFVLNWALENLAPMQLLPERSGWIHVRYEDLVTAPVETLERLADGLSLDDLDAMQAAVTRPSQSSRRSTKATRASIEAGATRRAWDWLSEVDVDTHRRTDRTLVALGIDPVLLRP